MVLRIQTGNEKGYHRNSKEESKDQSSFVEESTEVNFEVNHNRH